MKRYLIVFSFILFFRALTFSQVYQPFPTENAMWRESSGGYQCSCCEDFQYTISGDTTINDLSYYKLHKTGIKYLDIPSGNCHYDKQIPVNIYAGCFRDDETEKKVYYIPPSENQEILLYDFNLVVGDTLPPMYMNGFQKKYLVVGEDSMELSGKFYRYFAIKTCENSSYDFLIIEGVGSTNGLLSRAGCLFEALYALKCFSINKETVFPNNTEPCIEAIVSVEEKGNIDLESISLFPNPANGTINISISDNYQAIHFKLYDSKGSLIKSFNSDSNFITIEIPENTAGIYFLTALRKDGSFNKTFKIINQ
jgi:hypothetical protein